MALAAGHTFGNYQLVKLIGEGGFGEVYLVENPLIKRQAAVKVLLPELARSPEVVGRFLNEARAASAIRHPNIVDVLDAGATPDGSPYILMEFLDGEPLHRRMAREVRLSLDEVLSLARQACSALAAAHAAGIVHRDLKPENLFLVPDEGSPSGELLKILDFGIAKIISGEAAAGTVKTRAGLIMGSPVYMSPEQCKDTGQVDLRTDIYSLAVILYEALAGRPPHQAESGTELMIMHLTADPPLLGELVPELPPYVSGTIMKALAREPDDRFPDMPSFMAALCDEQESAPARPIVDRPSSRVRPRPAATAIMAPSAGAAQPKPIRARKPTPIPRPNGTTTLSRSTGETSGAAEVDAAAQGRFPRRVVAAAAAVVVLGGAVTLTAVLVGRRGPAKDLPKASAISQPLGPEPSVKPPELAAPPSVAPAPPAVAVPLPAAAESAPDKAIVEPKPSVSPDEPRAATRAATRPTGAEAEGAHRQDRAKGSGRSESASRKPEGRSRTGRAAPVGAPQPAAPASGPAVIKHQKF
jgi:eukaryotic-like serine/threonine-protein kinase